MIVAVECTDLGPGDIVGSPEGPAFAVLATPVVIANHDVVEVWAQLHHGVRSAIVVKGAVDVLGAVVGSPADPRGRQSISDWDSYDHIADCMNAHE